MNEPPEDLSVRLPVDGGELARIAPQPSEAAHIRRCQRLLRMVGELHKRGYQRLRITPSWYDSLGTWRCDITPRSNTLRVHGAVWADDAQPLRARYSSAAGSEYFEWPEAPSADARQLAQLFVERFPEIAAAGLGRDYEYAGWYVEVLGVVEHGYLPIAWGGRSRARGATYLQSYAGPRLPMPPGGDAELPERVEGFHPFQMA